MITNLREARAEASEGKLSLILLEPLNVGRNNCLGLNYCLYTPGTTVKNHAHERLEQITYIVLGRAIIQVRQEERLLTKDEAVYIPANTAHTLENNSNNPLVTVNAYYPIRRHYELWKDNINAFLTKINPEADISKLKYPSEI